MTNIVVSQNNTDTIPTIKIENYIFSDTSSVNNEAISLIPADSIQTKDSIPRIKKPKEEKKGALSSPFDYIASDSTELLLGEQKIRLYKNAQVNYESIELKAENIILDMNTKIIVAYGNTDSNGVIIGKPNFKDGGENFDADTIVYNFESKKGIIKGVFTKEGEGYLHSEVNKKLPNNEICLKNGKYTTCDHEHPHFYLALTHFYFDLPHHLNLNKKHLLPLYSNYQLVLRNLQE